MQSGLYGPAAGAFPAFRMEQQLHNLEQTIAAGFIGFTGKRHQHQEAPKFDQMFPLLSFALTGKEPEQMVQDRQEAMARRLQSIAARFRHDTAAGKDIRTG